MSEPPAPDPAELAAMDQELETIAFYAKCAGRAYQEALARTAIPSVAVALALGVLNNWMSDVTFLYEGDEEDE